jgi:hypothetical protein
MLLNRYVERQHTSSASTHAEKEELRKGLKLGESCHTHSYFANSNVRRGAAQRGSNKCHDELAVYGWRDLGKSQRDCNAFYSFLGNLAEGHDHDAVSAADYRAQHNFLSVGQRWVSLEFVLM